MELRYKNKILGGNSGGSSGSGEVYSTEETRVGTWIDGKPLYRKVIQGNGPPALNAWAVIGQPIPDIEYIAKVDAYIANTNTGTWIPLPFVVQGHGTVSALYDITGTDGRVVGLNVFSNYSGITEVPIMAILEYTKTTDEAI